MKSMTGQAWELRMYEPGPGMLLIALPSLTDPTFARSVVYLLESDGESGSAGLILNAPTRTPVAQVLPSWHDATAEPSVVFRGGPVQPNGALCLARLSASPDELPTPGIRPVRHRPTRDSVGLVDLDGDTDVIRSAAQELRVYAGHAGWGAGQLENELAEGAWVVVPGSAADVFSSDPDTLWADALRRQPVPLNLLATYPDDPTLN